MKKAQKIITRLEQITSESKSDIIVVNQKDKIIFEKKENQNLLQLIYFVLVIAPWLMIYFQLFEISSFGYFVIATCSILVVRAYFKGPFQTDNRIEIDLNKEEIRLHRKSYFGKLLANDRIVKTKNSNQILKENIPLSDSLDVRLTLQSDGEQIPLIDLKNDSTLDQVFLALNLLVK